MQKNIKFIYGAFVITIIGSIFYLYLVGKSDEISLLNSQNNFTKVGNVQKKNSFSPSDLALLKNLNFNDVVNNDIFKAEIEKEVLQYKKTYLNKSTDFDVEAYRIDQTALRRTEIDYTTTGILGATYEQENSYLKLFDTYYNQLMKILSKEDQNKLIKNQKSWLVYKNTENELFLAENKNGGTMGSVAIEDGLMSLTKDRARGMFNFLNTFSENKQDIYSKMY